MKDEIKIQLVDKILETFKTSISSDEMPVLVGYLSTRFGLKGFQTVAEGHPVFEFQGKYIIYLESENQEKIVKPGQNIKYEYVKIAVPFYKETLKNKIVNI